MREHTLAVGLEEAEKEGGARARATSEAAQQADKGRTRSPKACGSANPARCAASRSPRCPPVRRAKLDEVRAAVGAAKNKLIRARRPRARPASWWQLPRPPWTFTRRGLDDVAASLAAAASGIRGHQHARSDRPGRRNPGPGPRSRGDPPPGTDGGRRRTARTSPRTRPGLGRPAPGARLGSGFRGARRPGGRPGRRLGSAGRLGRAGARGSGAAAAGPGRRGFGPAAGDHRRHGRAARACCPSTASPG